MNEGQFQEMKRQLTQLNEAIDEIRRALNRIDGRLKRAEKQSKVKRGS